ncbi:ferredoxin [Aeromicrobium marinum]
MANDYFEVGDDDVLKVLDGEVPESDRAHVHSAIQACPVLALRLED